MSAVRQTTCQRAAVQGVAGAGIGSKQDATIQWQRQEAPQALLEAVEDGACSRREPHPHGGRRGAGPQPEPVGDVRALAPVVLRSMSWPW